MSRIPNNRDVRFRRAQAAQQAADASVVARVVTLEETGVGGSLPDITGPAILGRESGTGQPVAITLGPGFSIVGGVLTYTPPVTP